MAHVEINSKMRNQAGMPPKPGPSNLKKSEEELDTERRVFALVTQVAKEGDGCVCPADWALIAHEAKRRGYLREHGKCRLYLTDHGRQWLSMRAGPAPRSRAYEMIKISLPARVLLKDLSHDTGVTMQETVGAILAAIHENRDALTRLAREHGLTYPWEAIAVLVRSR